MSKVVITYIQTKVCDLDPKLYPNLENPTPENMIKSEMEAWKNNELDIDIIMEGSKSEVIMQLL